MATNKSDYQRIFAAAFTKTATLLAEAKKDNNALHQYLESWLEIADLAASLDNFALQDIVLLFAETSETAFESVLFLSDEHWESLEQWGNLFENYINAPDNLQAATHLIKHLNTPLLDAQLLDADEEMFLDGFTQVSEQLSQTSDDFESPSETSSSSIEKKSQLDSEKLSLWQAITPAFKSASVHLKKIVTGDMLAVTEYEENWQNIMLTIVDEGEYDALSDMVLLFIEMSSSILSQPNGLDEKQMIVLNKWHSLFDSYLKSSSNRALVISLIKCLSDTSYPDAITLEDEKMLLSGFDEMISITTQQSQPTAVETTPNLESSLEIEETTVSSPSTWEMLKPALQASSQYLKTAVDQQIINHQSAFLESLHQYRITWQEIVSIMENDENCTALLDVVLLFYDVSGETFDGQNELTAEQVGLLNKWQSLFLDYIDDRDNLLLLKSLIECLSNSVWSSAIEDDDVELLLEAFSVSEKEQESLSVESWEDNDTNEKSLSEVSEDSVWEKVSPIFEKISNELTTIIDLQIEGKEIDHCVQVYIQYWQQIADILDENKNQSGLMDVVLLFTEVSIPAFEGLNSQQLTLFNQWHHLFNRYIKAQGDRTLAKLLIDCLLDSAWPEALSQEDGNMLLEGFITDDDNRLTTDEESHALATESQSTEEPFELWNTIELFFVDSLAQLNNLSVAIAVHNVQDGNQSLQKYASSWENIAETISDNGHDVLQNLMNISLLFSENCTELVEKKQTLTHEFMLLLNSWHKFFKAYVENKTDTQPLISLVKVLESSLWVNPLTEDDKGMLLESIEAISEHESSAVFKDGDDDFLELFAEAVINENEETSELLSDDLIDENESSLELFTDDMLIEEEALEASDELETLEHLNNQLINETDDTEEIKEDSDAIEATLVDPDLIEMVRDEFVVLIRGLAPVISDISDAEAFKNVLKEHHFKFENLAKACHTIGLLGLEKVFEQLSVNMRSRRESDKSFSEAERILFRDSLPLVQAYIMEVNNKECILALVEHFQLSGWKQALNDTQARSLKILLPALELISPEEQRENRKTTAEVADVSLELPADVNQELLDSLLNELPILTADFSGIIQKIISSNRHADQLLEAQRIAHTLKGAGNIVGISGIAVLTHHLEEVLEYLTEKQRFPTKALAESLLEAADCLEMMSEIILMGEWHAPDQAMQVLQNILDWSHSIAQKGLPEEGETEEDDWSLPSPSATDNSAAVQPTKAVESAVMTRVSSELVDNLLRMTGEGSILSEQFKERINRFSEELKDLNKLTWQMQTLVSELDQSINIQSYAGKSATRGNEFDALEMEQYNELHTATSRLAEVATDIREVNIGMDEQLVDLKYLMMDEEVVQKENQEMVQSIRMVPVSTIASRCQRIVRQACRIVNKEVELEIKGGDVLIDSEILNDMVDPLMHLLRNSVDHGIEPKHIRQRHNKNDIGQIILEFSRQGNYALITCKDDGGGLSSGNILQTAIKKGLISANQKLTDAEIHKLILIPGFSTRSVATQVSGRGIGMDAIQTKISSLQGQMSLSSVRGEGLNIEITIPLTLASMLSLLVRCGNQTMAISNRGLEKIHHADDCDFIEYDGEELVAQIEGRQHPVKYFGDLLGMSAAYDPEKYHSIREDLGVGEQNLHIMPALRIVDEIGKTYIVFVDELLGYRDLLVKSMGSYIPHIQGVTGASILGNGDVVPVIDLVEMLHNSAKYDFLLVDPTQGLVDSMSGLPVALVVDDSLSARRAVAMLLEDSAIDVETAIDGLDAIKQIEIKLPDILVVDLEMPRMNGIELTAHIRGRDDTKNIPVIMITSRATEKHRKQAKAAGVTLFMTKPFSEDELMNNVRSLMKG